jgi:hypothetical protein
MVVTKSGTPAIAVVGIIGVAGLLLVTVSPVTGVVVAVNVGVVPTVAADGETGTLNVLSRPALMGPAFVQITEGAVVEHVQLFDVKVAGAETPAGKVMVVVITPRAGPVPILATVTGILLV